MSLEVEVGEVVLDGEVAEFGDVDVGGEIEVVGEADEGIKAKSRELGGKSPLIILPDTEIENAVDGAMMANFFSTGQVCTNGTRVFVHKSMKAAFEKRLLETMELVRALEPMDPNSNFGPLSSELHYKKVLGMSRCNH